MNPQGRMRDRMSVILHMVMAFVICILLVQLWLFTVVLEAMENRSVSLSAATAGLVVSSLGCIAVWVLIRFFLRAEGQLSPPDTGSEHT